MRKTIDKSVKITADDEIGYQRVPRKSSAVSRSILFLKTITCNGKVEEVRELIKFGLSIKQ